MAHDLVFRNGVVLTPVGLVQGGVAVDGETITAVGSDRSLGQARRTIDLAGRILFPGIIDPHLHFGFGDDVDQDTQVTDFAVNSKDCLVGGVTTISTTTLVGREPLSDLLVQARESGQDRSYCDYRVSCCVSTRDQVEEIPALIDQGVVSFKFFTGYIGEQAEGFGMNPEGITPALFYEACEAIKRSRGKAFAQIHAEEPTVRGLLIDRLRERPEGGKLTAWADCSPAWAEAVQIFMYGQIANEVGVPLYPVHVSSKEALETIRWMRQRGFDITAETLALFLNTTAEEMDAAGWGGEAKIQPPIRHQTDQDALWQALGDGTIATIGTDSLTYSARYKSGTDFWDCRVGVNLQVADTMPLLYTQGVDSGRLDLVILAKLLSENSARRFGMFPKKGQIALGSYADLVIIDQDREIRLGVERYLGNTDYCLWEGRPAKGVPVMTVVRGEIAAEDGEITSDSPTGRFVDRAWFG